MKLDILRSHFFAKFLYNSPVIVFIFLLLLPSCNSTNAGNTRPSESVASDAGDIRNAQSIKEKDTVLADTLYNSLPHSTPWELCNRYQLKAVYFLETGDNIKAIVYADSMLHVIQNNGLQLKLALLYGKAHFIKGDVFLAWKDYTSAFQYYYEGRKEVELAHDTCAFADYTSKLGTACYNQANYLAAARYFKQCVSEFESCDKSDYRRFHNQQGNLDNTALCYDKYGMTDSAVHYYLMALDYITTHENEFPREKQSTEISKGVIYGNLATTYFKIGKLQDAETLFKKSISINTKKGYAIGDAQLTQLKLADLYLKTSRLNDAQQVLKDIKGSLDSLPSEKNWRRDIQARVYKLQSEYYNHLHNPEVANTYLNAYITLKDSIDNASKKLVSGDFNREFETIENKYAFAVLKKHNQQKTVYLAIACILGIMSIVILLLIWQNGKRLKKLNETITRQNAEMQTAMGALEQSQAENTKMMKIVSHDLRSPISAIVSIATIMLGEPHTEDQKQMLEMIRTSGRDASEFINDLLHINFADKEMDVAAVEMAPLMQHCVDLLQFKANEKAQDIVLKIEPVTLMVNRQKIWRVMSNLITNAIKFSPGGTTIFVAMVLKPGKLCISVKDQGIGIPPGMENEVFKMFTGAMRLGTSGELSFGIGLAISRQIVTAHNGKIWYENGAERGTTFFVELPTS